MDLSWIWYEILIGDLGNSFCSDFIWVSDVDSACVVFVDVKILIAMINFMKILIWIQTKMWFGLNWIEFSTCWEGMGTGLIWLKKIED